MKKMLVLITAAMVLSVTLAGCSQKPTNAPDTDSESAFVSEFSENAPTEYAADETTSSLLAGEESQTAESNTADTNSTAPKVESASPQQATSEKPAQQPETAQKPTPQPVTEQPRQETPVSQPTSPPETEKPTTTQPPAPSFDVSAYISYAKSYGQSVGLSLDSTATACWDDPLNANAGCTCLERDLKDRLDWYKASGYTGFWVWSENIGNGAYQIYIGYA